MREALTLILSLSVAACTTNPSWHCLPGERAATLDTLYFGTATPDGPVKAEAWGRFLERSVTPRFPEGLTVWDAAGQWRNGAGPIEREASHVLQIVHPGTLESEAVIRGIMDEYRARFRQKAVLRVRSLICMSF